MSGNQPRQQAKQRARRAPRGYQRKAANYPKNNAKFSTCLDSDAGGRFTEYYTDGGDCDGYGDKPHVQRWYGPWADASDKPPGEWYPVTLEDGPDRTDRGYWRDNR